jgi:phosphatidylserine/phosphatidylglycerophosphate/cardiolipin synthase-like enzyme
VIQVRTLTDGGQEPADVAGWVAGFLAEARRTLDLAIYDFALKPETAAPIVQAVRDAIGRGVVIRLAYNVEHDRAIPVPPPSRTEEALVHSLVEMGMQARPIPGVPDLMHQKFVVRDGETVWTGSTNWTDDSWSREENVVVEVSSRTVASSYSRDFEGIWDRRSVSGSGAFDPEPDLLDGVRIQPWFSPGRGRRIVHRIAAAIGAAERRVRVCSPVITAGPILGTLAEVAAAKSVELSGVYDATQMRQVFGQWREDPHAAWKIPAFRSIVRNAPFGGKRTTPYGPGTVHDYMHAKITIADETVFVGSYNLSHSGEMNAENVLEITHSGLADRLAAFVDGLRTRYPAASLA